MHKGHCSVRSDVSFCSDSLELLGDRSESPESPLSEGVGLTGHPPHRELEFSTPRVSTEEEVSAQPSSSAGIFLKSRWS